MTSKRNYWNVLRTGLTACLVLCVQFGFGQTLQTITDKRDILIGEQVELKVKASFDPALYRVRQWISVPDSIPHFDIVERLGIDTISNSDNTRTLEQKIILTSFDSGRWSFPALLLNFDPLKDDTTYNKLTDSFYVNVSYAPADSTNQLRDIKPIIKVSAFSFFWLYVAAAVLLLLLIALLLYFYFKKKKQQTPATVASKLSPYDEAMKALESIAGLNLQDAADIKIFHVKLAEIFKTYLGRKQSRNLFNKTTGELLIQVKETNAPAETISQLATVLRCTDAVKFAKYLPAAGESEDALQKIKETIELTERKTDNGQRTTNNAV